jgi:hypothetical protein
MRTVLPIHFLDVDQTKVRLVHQRRGLKAVAGTLAGHMALRNPMELLLHQRNQTRQRCVVASTPRQQETRDVVNRCGNPRILRRFGLSSVDEASQKRVARSQPCSRCFTA